MARIAGVSKSTVSLVLRHSEKVSKNTKEKVLSAIKQTGYVYNREAAAMRSKSSDLVAIVINDLTHPFFAKLAVSIEAHIRKLGFMTTLVSTNENALIQTQVVAKLQEYRVKAFVICPTVNTQASWLNQLRTPSTQVITVIRQVNNCDVSCVLPNNELGTFQATKALIARGHKHIAFIGGDATVSDYQQRLNGFNSAINTQSDLHSWVFNSVASRYGGRMAMSECLAQVPQVESIVCFNDMVAYGSVEHLLEQGLKPGENIGVIGFDDLDESKNMGVPLSTVQINTDEIAKTVCNIIQGITCEGLHQIPVALIERDS
ncbi:Maltose regulon regulatory protein MalI [Pseudoalteromonas holothuriae]|uniref:Maltose regulon regulatory protein MalI n=1 Tax=Pseudoalteromonas holothuriae TaxID=2963714 RepID=A0A9W4QT67_9GAMM|nr:Maltose regulon regulatory protein MalI [Pseudoalteromonas sp. CIP111854]CAH9057640.1 Maltose regulon regulatory protein MalI [Pseudoalteromonas sp. CIP111951]